MEMENFENIRLPWTDWKIVKYLGGGAYGKVYEIERNIYGIQDKEAVKIVSRPKDESEIESYYDNGYDKASIIESCENEIQNYVQEYRVMKELQGQSNIVSCEDFTVVPHEDGIGGDIFIRMELLTPLQKVTKERGLSEEEIIKLGKDICKALILCESRNIIHRDIKPDNVMISKFGDFKLGDFGVSKVMGHTTAGTMTGTEGYIAPEVLHLEKYGKEVDIYSLGIVMYWLLNNRRMPFVEATGKMTTVKVNEAYMRRYSGEKIPAPYNGSVELKQIVLKACEYRPKDRYTSAQEMYDALFALENGNTVIEKPPVTIEPIDPGKSSETETDELQKRGTVKGYVTNYEYNGDGKTLGNSWDDKTETIGKPMKPEKPSNAGQGGFQRSTVKNGFKVTVQNDFGTEKQKEPEKRSNVEQGGFQHSTVINGFKVTVQNDFKTEEPEEISSETIGIKNIKPKEKKNYSESDEQYMRVFGDDLKRESELVLTQIEEKRKPETNKRFNFLESKEHKEKRLFDEWMKKIKEKFWPSQNIDNYIRLNPDFARRLYYEKCPEKYLLEYMEKLNPEVVKEIRASE